ncbi:hypothetical protein LQ318_11615 [Aliifodinibius salicampi]|uniref:DUF4440 domain-containing protein n=1 Tax=Fodinibius salicampi TaxID=1920655 RepID=A0ABT3Q0A7_9BACT|nr:hypothetical protein [Fodinibius salicampi]MCW9713548.1 hypothetical protein [Fodinibius salicampi]
MKKYYLTIGLCLIAMGVNAQWLTETSCNEQSNKITDKAIAHLVNLESSVAVGMANAALMIDEKCGAAKLVKVNAALGGQYGSRDQQVKDLDTQNFTEQEKAWHKILAAPDEEESEIRIEMAEAYPKVPLFSLLASLSAEDGDRLTKYVQEFPEYASSAYNTMSYYYAQGEYGEPDMEKALETVKKVFLTHDGPNAHDSMAEHYALMGDYESAFKHQVMALDYAAMGGSGYGVNAGIYLRQSNKVDLTDSLKTMTKKRIAFQMENDIENLAQFYSEDVGMIACNSDMEPCVFYETLEEEDLGIVWNRWDVSDLKVYFSPDMRVAVTTFNNDGEYTVSGSDTPVAYKTRASEVWTLDNGWKLMHSNFAPLAFGSGIPKTE